jgi:hypothetical protein
LRERTREGLTTFFVFRQRKDVADVFSVMTMPIMVILKPSSYLKKQDDRYDPSEIRLESAPSAHGRCSKHVITHVRNIDVELGRPRFHGSTIFHNGHAGLSSGPEAIVQGRPYTGSDGGGRAGFWPAALRPLSKPVLTPAQTAVAVQVSGQRP